MGKRSDTTVRQSSSISTAPAKSILAYGLRGLVTRRFEKPGRPLLTADVYEMGSSADAYGVFSFERQDEEIGIGQGSEFGGGLLRFWKGNYFVSVNAEGEGEDVDKAIMSLGRAVAAAITKTGPRPRSDQLHT